MLVVSFFAGSDFSGNGNGSGDDLEGGMVPVVDDDAVLSGQRTRVSQRLSITKVCCPLFLSVCLWVHCQFFWFGWSVPCPCPCSCSLFLGAFVSVGWFINRFVGCPIGWVFGYYSWLVGRSVC